MKLKKHSDKSVGAGFVLYKKVNGEKKVVVLIKPNGKFDLPKGHTDPTDIDAFSTAQRECFEETGIFVTKSDLLTPEAFVNDGLTMFCAETTQEATVSRNPESGKFEHIACIEIDSDSARGILPKYLSKAVAWSCRHA